MTQLEHLAERAKTSIEAEVRARVTWPMLQELAGRFNDAKKAYYAHPLIDGANPESDLEKMRLDDALETARAEYTKAMKKYQEQGK